MSSSNIFVDFNLFWKACCRSSTSDETKIIREKLIRINLLEYFPKLISKLSETKKFGSAIFNEIYQFLRVLESTLEPDDLNKIFLDQKEKTLDNLCEEIEKYLENNPSDTGTC